MSTPRARTAEYHPLPPLLAGWEQYRQYQDPDYPPGILTVASVRPLRHMRLLRELPEVEVNGERLTVATVLRIRTLLDP